MYVDNVLQYFFDDEKYLFTFDETKNNITMERIIVLLQHVIDSARINGNEDIEIAASVFKGSIEQGIVDEFSVSCEKFTQQKVDEIIFINECKRIMQSN